MSSCSLTEHDIIAGRKGAHLNVFFFINDSCKNDKEPESSSIHMTKDEKMAQMTWKTALHWSVTGKQNELACSKELRRFLWFFVFEFWGELYRSSSGNNHKNTA